MALPLDGETEPQILLQTEFNDWAVSVSPDGRWLAYISDESGTFEVYVMPFPGPGRRWQVSTQGGFAPYWRADGRELIYVQPGRQLMAVDVDGRGDSFRVGRVQPLFSISTDFWFSPTADAQSFLIAAEAAESAVPLLNLVLNWPEKLKRQ